MTGNILDRARDLVVGLRRSAVMCRPSSWLVVVGGMLAGGGSVAAWAQDATVSGTPVSTTTATSIGMLGGGMAGSVIALRAIGVLDGVLALVKDIWEHYRDGKVTLPALRVVLEHKGAVEVVEDVVPPRSRVAALTGAQPPPDGA